MKKEKLIREVNFGMPYDKRHINPKKNYGISSMRIWFILKGSRGAVQVLIGTKLYLTSVVKEYQRKNIDLFEDETFTCWDVGYHSPKPMFEGQEICDNECKALDGEPCYYDGSSLIGDELGLHKLFEEQGEEPIWEFLEKEYYEVFY